MRLLRPRWYDRLDSTNAFLLDLAVRDAGLPAGTVIAAREQTAGRGRRGRPWLSTPGRDLAFSFLVRVRAADARLLSLPMTTAVSVGAALAELGLEPVLKWPNDVLVRGRKICGVLAETRARTADVAVVVGVGLNLNMTSDDCSRVGRPATSVMLETGAEVGVEAMLQRLLACLAPRLLAWEREGFAGVRGEWEERAHGRGRGARVRVGRETVAGTVTGWGPDGELLLGQDDGSVRRLASGTVTQW